MVYTEIIERCNGYGLFILFQGRLSAVPGGWIVCSVEWVLLHNAAFWIVFLQR